MNTPTKWTLGALALVSTFLVASTVTHAHGRWSPMSNAQTPAEYQMNESQIPGIERIQSKYEAKLLPLKKELAATRVEFEWVAQSSGENSSAARELRRKIDDLEARIEDLRAEANEAAADLLTPEQRRYYGDEFDVLGCGHGSCISDHACGDMRCGAYHASGAMSWGSYRGHGDTMCGWDRNAMMRGHGASMYSDRQDRCMHDGCPMR